MAPHVFSGANNQEGGARVLAWRPEPAGLRRRVSCDERGPPPALCHFRQSELVVGNLAVGATEFTAARFYENEAHGLVALWAGRWRGVLGHVTLTLDRAGST
jgi:hypothetical protein